MIPVSGVTGVRHRGALDPAQLWEPVWKSQVPGGLVFLFPLLDPRAVQNRAEHFSVSNARESC